MIQLGRGDWQGGFEDSRDILILPLNFSSFDAPASKLPPPLSAALSWFRRSCGETPPPRSAPLFLVSALLHHSLVSTLLRRNSPQYAALSWFRRSCILVRFDAPASNLIIYYSDSTSPNQGRKYRKWNFVLTNFLKQYSILFRPSLWVFYSDCSNDKSNGVHQLPLEN
jgi:hypothetical protein